MSDFIESSKNAIVAYVDLMGFSRLIQNNDISGDKVFQIFERVLKSIEEINTNTDLKNRIGIKLVSDSFIFYLNLDDVKDIKVPRGWSSAEDFAVNQFLLLCSMVGLYFFVELDCPPRGGVEIGEFALKHFDAARDKQMFIFSKALTCAASLEKEAVYPRLLIGDQLYNQYIKHNEVLLDRIWTDIDDNKKAVNLYSYILLTRQKQIFKEYFGRIRDRLKNRKFEAEVLMKRDKFAEVHNFVMEENQLTEFLIPTN